MSDESFVAEMAAELDAAPAPEPEAPAPAPEPVVAEPEPAAPAPEPQRPQIDMVPQARLHAERQRYEATVASLKADLAALKASLAPKPEPMPDPKADPLGWIERQEAERQKQLAEGETKAQTEAREREEAQAERQLLKTYRIAADQAKRAVPDFMDAYRHLTAWGEQQLINDGIDDPEERAAMLEEHEKDLVRRAVHAGYNPAEIIYYKAREHGYQGRQQQAPAPAAPPPAAAPAPIPPRDPATGQFQPVAVTPPPKAPRSLSQVPGTPGGQVTADALLAMSGKDFDKMFADGDGWRKLHSR